MALGKSGVMPHGAMDGARCAAFEAMPLCTPASYNALLAGYFHNRLPDVTAASVPSSFSATTALWKACSTSPLSQWRPLRLARSSRPTSCQICQVRVCDSSFLPC
ncbi:hypothetical protein GUJ93_ZPchr0011g27630 [Zizania palustris]|uniref:Uncharacterized protein n=1 Tax=Zizania palustris TaxID=103762 RepID=A0A8J6BLE6_ZIZPA|nr:hypothetical protein GUJ93_ZPchr0011g27630 [Zizania palustris]